MASALQGVQNHLPSGRLSPEQWIRAVRYMLHVGSAMG